MDRRAWYYRRDGKTYGPLSEAQLKQAVAAGSLDARCQVARSPDGPWRMAFRIAGLGIDPPDPPSSQEAAGGFGDPPPPPSRPNAGQADRQADGDPSRAALEELVRIARVADQRSAHIEEHLAWIRSHTFYIAIPIYLSLLILICSGIALILGMISLAFGG